MIAYVFGSVPADYSAWKNFHPARHTLKLHFLFNFPPFSETLLNSSPGCWLSPAWHFPFLSRLTVSLFAPAMRPWASEGVLAFLFFFFCPTLVLSLVADPSLVAEKEERRWMEHEEVWRKQIKRQRKKNKQRGKTDPGIERHREKTLRNKERKKEVEGKDRGGGEERKINMLWERRMEE